MIERRRETVGYERGAGDESGATPVSHGYGARFCLGGARKALVLRSGNVLVLDSLKRVYCLFVRGYLSTFHLGVSSLNGVSRKTGCYNVLEIAHLNVRHWQENVLFDSCRARRRLVVVVVHLILEWRVVRHDLSNLFIHVRPRSVLIQRVRCARDGECRNQSKVESLSNASCDAFTSSTSCRRRDDDSRSRRIRPRTPYLDRTPTSDTRTRSHAPPLRPESPSRTSHSVLRDTTPRRPRETRLRLKPPPRGDLPPPPRRVQSPIPSSRRRMSP